MSSTQNPDPQPPPPTAVTSTRQAYTPHSGHGSVGPVIAVLAVITILGAIAVMIGRLCSGRRIMGHGQYDFEGWVETKCSTCLDGRVDPPPSPAVVAEINTSSSSDTGDAAQGPAETPQEPKEEEIINQGDIQSRES